jgi:hypothetical protein
MHLQSQPDQVITPRGRMTGVHTGMCLQGQTEQATNPGRLVTGTRSSMRLPGQTDPLTPQRDQGQAKDFVSLPSWQRPSGCLFPSQCEYGKIKTLVVELRVTGTAPPQSDAPPKSTPTRLSLPWGR